LFGSGFSIIAAASGKRASTAKTVRIQFTTVIYLHPHKHTRLKCTYFVDIDVEISFHPAVLCQQVTPSEQTRAAAVEFRQRLAY